MSKVPYFLPISGELPATNKTWNAERCPEGNETQWCYGMEVSYNLCKWTGFRSIKLFADPPRYLAVHATLGSSCLLVLVLLWLRKTTIDQAKWVFFVATSVLWLHVLPYLHGVPGRQSGPVDPPFTPSGFGNILVKMLCVHLAGLACLAYSQFGSSDKGTAHNVLTAGYVLCAMTPSLAASMEFRVIFERFYNGVQWEPAESNSNTPLQWSGQEETDPYTNLGSPHLGTAAVVIIVVCVVAATVRQCLNPPNLDIPADGSEVTTELNAKAVQSSS